MRATFSPAELAYLQSERRLARLATADDHGRPQVTPVGMWRLNPALGSVDIGGRDFSRTRKFRNVAANPQAALLIDDMASVNPWRPRAVIIEGAAQALDEEGGMIRIVPDRIISWGLD